MKFIIANKQLHFIYAIVNFSLSPSAFYSCCLGMLLLLLLLLLFSIVVVVVIVHSLLPFVGSAFSLIFHIYRIYFHPRSFYAWNNVNSSTFFGFGFCFSNKHRCPLYMDLPLTIISGTRELVYSTWCVNYLRIYAFMWINRCVCAMWVSVCVCFCNTIVGASWKKLFVSFSVDYFEMNEHTNRRQKKGKWEREREKVCRILFKRDGENIRAES